MKRDISASTIHRNAWFDNAKAYLIITVVIGHIAEFLLATVQYDGEKPVWLEVLMKCIYVFHMPVFMSISGRFSKKRIDNGDWIAVINKLVVPYIVAQTIMMLFYSVTGYSSPSNISYFKPGFGLWYLFALSIYQLITPHLIKLFRKKWIILPISLCVALALTFQEVAFLGAFQRVFNYFPFFIFGYLTANHDFAWCKKPIFRVFSGLSVVALVFLVLHFNEIIQVPLLSGKRVYAQYLDLYGYKELSVLILMILRFAGGFAFFPIILGISSIKKNFFTKIGVDSSYVYVLHLFVAIALTAAGKNYNALDFCKNDLWGILLCLAGIPLSFLLVTPPIKKCTRWLVSPNFDLKKIAKKIIDT